MRFSEKFEFETPVLISERGFAKMIKQGWPDIPVKGPILKKVFEGRPYRGFLTFLDLFECSFRGLLTGYKNKLECRSVEGHVCDKVCQT
jgi:hypothetical protein